MTDQGPMQPDYRRRMEAEHLDRLAVLAAGATREHDPADEDGFPWAELIDGLDTGDVIGLCECDRGYLDAVDPATVTALIERVKEAEAEVRELWSRIDTDMQAEARAEAAEQRAEGLAKAAHDWEKDAQRYRTELAAAEAREQALRDRVTAATALLDEWALCIRDPKRQPAWSGGAILADLRSTLLSPPTADTRPEDKP